MMFLKFILFIVMKDTPPYYQTHIKQLLIIFQLPYNTFCHHNNASKTAKPIFQCSLAIFIKRTHSFTLSPPSSPHTLPQMEKNNKKKKFRMILAIEHGGNLP